MRLLLIDDNRDDRVLIRRELSRHFPHFEIEDIRAELDLRRALSHPPVDLVITDFELRWSNGLEVLERVKDRFPDCPVVMFTNTGTQEIAVAAMKAGLDDYIVKSAADYARLPAAVDGALRRATARTQRRQRQRRFDEMLGAIGVGVFRAAADGRLEETNQTMLQLLGASSVADTQALDVSAMLAPRDGVRAFVVTVPRMGGGSIELRVSVGAVEGEPGGLVDGVARPVTE